MKLSKVIVTSTNSTNYLWYYHQQYCTKYACGIFIYGNKENEFVLSLLV